MIIKLFLLIFISFNMSSGLPKYIFLASGKRSEFANSLRSSVIMILKPRFAAKEDIALEMCQPPHKIIVGGLVKPSKKYCSPDGDRMCSNVP